MAYKPDSAEPRSDIKLFITKCIASIVFVALVIFIYKVVIGSMWGENDSLDVVKVQIEAEFLKENILNYNVTADTKTINVTHWDKGMVPIAKKAAEGDAAAIKEWDLQKEKMQYMASVVNDKKYMFDNVDDVTVVFKLVNEDNHARSLLTYKNGVLTYDVVQSTNGG